jgi:general secretion pathway protein J
MWRNRPGSGPAPARARRRRASATGFTLVELLVALAIFAILSGFAYRSLGALLDSREALQRESRKWRDVSLFVGRVERDLSAVLARDAIGASGTILPAVASAIGTVNDGNGLALTRAGSPLQQNALAAPQRIAYRLAGDHVERLSWAGVDAAPREEPQAVTVLAPVRALSFRFLDPASLEWRTTWPNGSDLLPAAVEVTVELASGERIVRLVDLPRMP